MGDEDEDSPIEQSCSRKGQSVSPGALGLPAADGSLGLDPSPGDPHPSPEPPGREPPHGQAPEIGEGRVLGVPVEKRP